MSVAKKISFIKNALNLWNSVSFWRKASEPTITLKYKEWSNWSGDEWGELKAEPDFLSTLFIFTVRGKVST